MQLVPYPNSSRINENYRDNVLTLASGEVVPYVRPQYGHSIGIDKHTATSNRACCRMNIKNGHVRRYIYTTALAMLLHWWCTLYYTKESNIVPLVGFNFLISLACSV
jgi:hypothetical protein